MGSIGGSKTGGLRPRRNSGFQLYLDAAGIAPHAAVGGAYTITAGGVNLAIPSGYATINLAGYTGIQMVLFGVGNDGGTFDGRVWGLRGIGLGNDEKGPAFYDYLGLLHATLSTAVGSLSTIVPLAARYADTLTWTEGAAGTTPKGWFDSLEDAWTLGVAKVYSPANNTPAVFLIPDLGGYERLFIEFGNATNVTYSNLMYDLINRE